MTRSNFEMVQEPDVEIFDLLSREQPVNKDNWRIYNVSYKIQIDFGVFEDGQSEKINYETNLSTSEPGQSHSSSFSMKPTLQSNSDQILNVNCTIAFLSQCMAFNKCKENCQMMGASAYRWFHNACCQCIGPCAPAPYGEEHPRCDLCNQDNIDDYVNYNSMAMSEIID